MALEPFIVGEAIISIFPVDDEGNAILDDPVYLGEVVTGLRMRQSMREVLDFPTGVNYHEAHHLGDEHEISVERVWYPDLPLGATAPAGDLSVTLVDDDAGNNPTNATDYRMVQDREYIMTIVWQTEDNRNKFCWRVYYGVTDVSKELAGSGWDGQMNCAHVWRAKYMVE